MLLTLKIEFVFWALSATGFIISEFSQQTKKSVNWVSKQQILNFEIKPIFVSSYHRFFVWVSILTSLKLIVAKNRNAFKKWSLGSNRVRELWNSVTRDVEHAEEAENDTSYFDI